jgi:hypothetical protein
MMNNRLQSRRFALLCGLAAGALCGCQRASLQFVSYKEPEFPETISLTFKDCVYRADPGGDLHIAGVARNETDHGRTDHYLYVHIFWKPRPGKTYAESTTTDATLTYVVATPRGAARYVGTGFAFPRQQPGRMLFDIESGRLLLESRTGDITDVLGDTRVSGTIEAAENPTAMVNILREAQIVARQG